MQTIPFAVLCKHWPDVPKWRDIKDVTADDVKRRTGCDHITLMSGGFPCQDVSDAGLRKGIHAERSGLVFEQIRILSDLRPDYAVFENVAGFRRRGLQEVLREIAKVGYDAEWHSLRASGFGATHKRERVFVVAHSVINIDKSGGARPIQWGMETENQSDACTLTHSDMQGLQRGNNKEDCRGKPEKGAGLRDAMSWPEVATRLCRVDDGVPRRVDRLRCLGNAVVPQQVYPILKAIADIERNEIAPKNP